MEVPVKKVVYVFVPEEEGIPSIEDAFSARALGRIELIDGKECADVSSLRERLEEAEKGVVLVKNPPLDAAFLQNADGVCKEMTGRLPVAVFFHPPRKRREEEWKELYRRRCGDAYRYFHKDRRAFVFEKSKPGALRKALKGALKRPGLIRWSVAGPVLLAGVVVAVCLLVFRDALLRYVLVRSLQRVAGAKVDIEDVHTDLVPLAVGIRGVKVGSARSPYTNVVEVDKVSVKVIPSDLLAGRFHATVASVEGMKFGTPRKTSAALPVSSSEKGEQAVAGVAAGKEESAGWFASLSGRLQGRLRETMGNILRSLKPPSPDDFSTPRTVERLRGRWKELSASVKVPDEKAFRAELEKLQGELEKLKRRTAPAALLKNIQDLRKETSALSGSLVEARKALRVQPAFPDFGGYRKRLASVDNEVKKSASTVRESSALLKNLSSVKKVKTSNIAEVRKMLKEADATLKRLREAKRVLAEQVKALKSLEAEAKGAVGSAEKAIRLQRKEIASARGRLKGVQGNIVKVKAEGLQRARKLQAQLERERKRVLAALAEVKKRRMRLAEQVKDMRRTLGELAAFYADARKQVESAVEKDKESLVRRYNVRNVDMEFLLQQMVGETLAKWISRGYGYASRLGLGKRGVRKATGEVSPERKGRLTGTRFDFPPPAGKPSVHVERCLVSLTLPLSSPLEMRGEGHDLSSSPAVCGKDMRMSLAGADGKRKVEMNLFVGKDGSKRFRLAFEGLRVGVVKMKGDYLPSDAGGGTASGEVVAEGGEGEKELLGIRGKIEVEGFSLGKPLRPRDRMCDVLGKVYGNIRSLELSFAASVGKEGKVHVKSVSTSLGRELNESLGRALKAEVDKLKKRAESMLARVSAESLKGIKAQLDARRAELDGRIGKLEGMLKGFDKRYTVAVGEVRERFDELRKRCTLDVPSPAAVEETLRELDRRDRALVSMEARLKKESDGFLSSLGSVEKRLIARRKGLDDTLSAVEKEKKRLEEALKKKLDGKFRGLFR